MISKFFKWIISFFIKEKKTKYDQEIKNKRRKIKEINKEIDKKYDNVDDALKEWRDDDTLH